MIGLGMSYISLTLATIMTKRGLMASAICEICQAGFIRTSWTLLNKDSLGRSSISPICICNACCYSKMIFSCMGYDINKGDPASSNLEQTHHPLFHPFHISHIHDQFGCLAATLRTSTATAVAGCVFTTSKSHRLGGHLWFRFLPRYSQPLARRKYLLE
jgi:hypothetical protein